LNRAAVLGLRDEAIMGTARDLSTIGLNGATALGSSFIGGEDLERARAFFGRFTGQGQSPSDFSGSST
jgi:hypothetical protein